MITVREVTDPSTTMGASMSFLPKKGLSSTSPHEDTTSSSATSTHPPQYSNTKSQLSSAPETTSTSDSANPLPIVILGAGPAGLALAQSILHNQPLSYPSSFSSPSSTHLNPPVLIFERDPAPNTRRQGYRVRLAGIGIDALRELLPAPVFAELEATKACLPKGTRMIPDPSQCFDAKTGDQLNEGQLKGKVMPPGTGPPGPPPQPQQQQQPAADVNNIVPPPPKVGIDHGRSDGGARFMNSASGSDEIWAVDRATLRRVLLRGLETTVRWGSEVASVGADGEGGEKGIPVTLRDGSVVRASLVVGADGAGSRVRRAVCPGLPVLDTGGRWVFGKTLLTPELEARFEDRGGVPGRLLAMRDEGHEGRPKISGVAEAMRFDWQRPEVRDGGGPKDYVYWVLQTREEFFASPQNVGVGAGGYDGEKLLRLGGKEAAALAVEMTREWNSSFKALFEMQDEESAAVLRVTTAPPTIPHWEPSLVTLIGDAAHVMSPTAAVGATSAFRDALGLARALREGGICKESVGKYEEAMRVYAAQGIRMSMMSGKWLFGMKDWEEMEPLKGSY